jgi:transposase
MSLKLLAIDLGKRSFHCHGIDDDGVVISRKTSRAKLLETIQELGPETTIAMEACAKRALLGSTISCRWPPGLADQSPVVKALRQRIQERRSGCRGNLRSRFAPDDEVRSSQIH